LIPLKLQVCIKVVDGDGDGRKVVDRDGDRDMEL